MVTLVERVDSLNWMERESMTSVLCILYIACMQPALSTSVAHTYFIIVKKII